MDNENKPLVAENIDKLIESQKAISDKFLNLWEQTIEEHKEIEDKIDELKTPENGNQKGIGTDI